MSSGTDVAATFSMSEIVPTRGPTDRTMSSLIAAALVLLALSTPADAFGWVPPVHARVAYRYLLRNHGANARSGVVVGPNG